MRKQLKLMTKHNYRIDTPINSVTDSAINGTNDNRIDEPLLARNNKAVQIAAPMAEESQISKITQSNERIEISPEAYLELQQKYEGAQMESQALQRELLANLLLFLAMMIAFIVHCQSF